MSEPLIKIRQVSKSFGKFLAVDSIDLDIEEGAFVAIMGPSGCGKTTTLRMIAGLEIPDRGSIHYRGSDVTFASPWDRRMPLVWQNLSALPVFECSGERRVRAKDGERAKNRAA